MPRRKHDFYETPDHYIEPLVQRISESVFDKGTVIYEPCVGDGCISRYLAECEARVVTNDIDSERRADYHFDATTAAAWKIPGVVGSDWCITNPPFNQWIEIARRALRRHDRVALLGRLSILEPTIERGRFWSLNPPAGIIVLPRYSFRHNDEGKRATDNVTCCWVVWDDSMDRFIDFVERP